MMENIYNVAPVWLQNVMCSVKGWLVSRRRYNKDFFDQLDLFENRKINPDHELHEFLGLVRHVPAYAKVFKAGKEVGLEDFPIINKQYVKDHYEDFLNRDYADPTIVVHTSGTTGNSLNVIQSRLFEHKQWAVWWRYREELGIKFGTWYGWFGCADMVVPAKQNRPPYWRVDVAGRRIMFGTYHLNIDNVNAYVDEIMRRKLTWLHGHASRLCYLSKLIAEKGISPVTTVNFVTTGSENLLPTHVEVIQKAFPNALIRTHYGMTEGVANFSQARNGEWHVDDDFAKVELIPMDPHRPNRCRVVGTNFSNPAFPLIRYDMGDIAIVDWSSGRPCVLGIEGRVNECVTLENGMLINSMLLYDLFGDVEHIVEAQVRVTGGLSLELWIVKADGYVGKDENAIWSNIKKYFKEEVSIAIVYVDVIPRSKSGKFVPVCDMRVSC